MSSKNTVAGAVQREAAKAENPQQEVPRHRRGLLRGQQLIALGFVLLALFGLVTAAVLLLNPLLVDVPVTLQCRDWTLAPLAG